MHETITQPKKENLPKIELVQPTLLEGAILVHGFRGNTGKTEVRTLIELLLSKVLKTPSQRDLSPAEKERYENVASMDLQRLCFHCQYEGQNKDVSYFYRGEALFAMPVKSAAGNVIVQDLQNGVTDVALYSKEGVKIPISLGVVLMTQSMFNQLKELLESIEVELKIDAEMLLKDHAMVVGDDVIGDPAKSWEKITEKVSPAAGVTYQMASVYTVNDYADNLLELYEQLLPATEEVLGS